MRKGSLGVTFFPSVRMHVRMSANFGKFIFLVNYNCDASYDHLWCSSIDCKWPGSGPEVTYARDLQVQPAIFYSIISIL